MKKYFKLQFIAALAIVITVSGIALSYTESNGNNDIEVKRKTIIQKYELEAWIITARGHSAELPATINREIVQYTLTSLDNGEEFSQIEPVNSFDSIEDSDDPHITLGVAIESLKNNLSDTLIKNNLSALYERAKNDLFLKCYLNNADSLLINRCVSEVILAKIKPASKDTFYLSFYRNIDTDIKEALEIIDLLAEYDNETIASWMKTFNLAGKLKMLRGIDTIEIANLLPSPPIWSDAAVKDSLHGYIKGKLEKPIFWDILSLEIQELISKAKVVYKTKKEDELKAIFDKIKNRDTAIPESWFNISDFPLNPTPYPLLYLTIAVIILAISLVALVMRIKYKQKNGRVGAASKNPYPAQGASESTDNGSIQQQATDYEKKSERLQVDYRALENKYLKVENENKELREKLAKLEDSQDMTSVNLSTQQPLIAEFYAIHPDVEGGFSLNSLSQNPEDGYFYKISQLNELEAELEVFPDPDIQILAAKSANSILRGACEFENLPSDTKTGILTTKKGILRKNDSEWTITKKARIRFI